MAKLKPKGQDTFEAGIYEVEGIDRWITTDSNGTPIWVDQKWGDDYVLVARYVTYKDTIEDGEKVRNEGPPGSIQPHDLALLVAAFGGDPSKLPDQIDSTKALLVAEEEINKSDKVSKVKVRDKGWISTVYDMFLPKGVYAFKFDGLQPRNNGAPYWRENKRYNTESVIAKLKVVGEVVEGEIENSIFEGVTQDAWLTRTALYVMRALVPTVYDSMLGAREDELKNLETMAYEEDPIIIGEVNYRNQEDNTPRLIRKSLRVHAEGENLPSKPEKSPVSVLEEFIEESTEDQAFAGGELTSEGKAWCKENLAEPCEQHGIPKEFDKMTKEQIIVLLHELGADDRAQELDSDGEEGW